jgi:hypothetical protein
VHSLTDWVRSSGLGRDLVIYRAPCLSPLPRSPLLGPPRRVVGRCSRLRHGRRMILFKGSRTGSFLLTWCERLDTKAADGVLRGAGSFCISACASQLWGCAVVIYLGMACWHHRLSKSTILFGRRSTHQPTGSLCTRMPAWRPPYTGTVFFLQTHSQSSDDILLHKSLKILIRKERNLLLISREGCHWSGCLSEERFALPAQGRLWTAGDPGHSQQQL